jgi:hypothetical protein
MIGKELKVRGFIEGVEIPIISATVSMAPNSPAAASIEIIATDAAQEIKPRSVVHLFFKDLWESISPNVYTAGEGIDQEFQVEKYIQILEEEQYRLLFCGEIMGYQFAKTPQARQITLQCADFSVYWDTSYYFSGGGFFSPSHLKKKFSMASGGFFEHLLLSKGEMVYKEFTTPPQGFPGVTGVLGGLIHLMQSVGGVYWKGANKFGGLNPFFSIAELKFHLTQQIAAADDDGPKKLLKSKGFGSIWNKSIRGLGKNFTYRQVINALQKYILYEVYPNPVARYVPGTGIYDEDDTSTKLLRNHPEYGYFVIAANQFQKSVERLLRDFMRDERAITIQEYRSSIKRIRKEMLSYISKAKAAEVKNVAKNFTSVRARAQTVLEALGNKLPKKGKRYNTILKGLNFMDDKLLAVYGFLIPGTKESTEDKPPFLLSQLFRPDIWFAAPPRCNVLFPEQYYQMQFGRNYMSEITRLLLRTHSSFFGSDILFDNFYYAPALPGTKAASTNKKGAKIPSLVEKSYNKLVDAKRDVMEHELYTGVLPKFERAGSHKVMGLRTGSTLAGGQTVGYAQRLANLLFFKYRYAARTVSVVGPFNPYLVPGFPCLVLDKPSDKSKIDEMIKELSKYSDDVSSIKGLTGTHYLGLISGMVHTLNQQGGQTQIQLQYARTHREEVEALGADIINNVKKKPSGSKPVTSYVCALYEPGVGQRGLYEGEILEVKEIPRGANVKVKGTVKVETLSETEEELLVYGLTKTVEKGGYVAAKEFPLLGTHIKKKGKKVKWKKKFDTLVRPWEKKPAAEFGPEVVGLVGSSTALVEFKLFQIVEDVVRTTEEQIDLPLEEIVRPPWYSTIWFNKSIGGAVYDKFFGTTAITDPLTVIDEYQSVSAPNEGTVEQEAAKVDIDSEDDLGMDINVITDIEQNTTIENAVDLLAYTYSSIKEGGYDVDEFIRAYTWRPVATMVDMFGTPDLELEYSGEVGKSPVVATQGQEGFHSRAFGDFKDLFGLVSPSVGQLIGVKNRFDPANARLDVRRERWLRVLAYVLELQERGLRG